jgi:hypothetical protein
MVVVKVGAVVAAEGFTNESVATKWRPRRLLAYPAAWSRPWR